MSGMSGLGSDTNILLRRVAEECGVDIDNITDDAILADLRMQAETCIEEGRDKNGRKEKALESLKAMFTVIDL